jgi:hypothetical protein
MPSSRHSRSRYVVRHSGDDRWEVLREGDRRATARVATRAEALRQARTLSRREGRELVELDRTGKVVSPSSRAATRRGARRA